MTTANKLSLKGSDFIRFGDKKDIIFRVALVVLLSIADGAVIFHKLANQENEQKTGELAQLLENDYTQIHSNFSLEKEISYNGLLLSDAPEITEPIMSNLDISHITESNDTLYNSLTENEITMIEIVIQHEVGNFSKEYKTCVAELIRNRLMSEDFPNTVTEVLFQKGQFQGISSWLYSGIIPDEETKAVVKEVFSAEDTSHKATFYYNPALSEYESVMWFEYSGDVDYLFEYTETNWGIEYTTRFFV